MRWIVLAALCASFAALAATKPTPSPAPPLLSAAEIVAKNVIARGGLDAWRKIETMAWTGRVEGPSGTASTLPFTLQLRRPNKTRFELAAADQRFTRIFDGGRGWRIRPKKDGGPEVKPFSEEEARFSRDEFVIDGPLIDFQSKGVIVSLAGVDQVEGRSTYLVNAKLPSGAERRIWIDSETFLEVRSDRPSTNPLVKGAPVSIYYRNYQNIDGVQIPMVIESRAADAAPSERLVIEKVVLNPQINEFAFAKPGTPRQRHAYVRIGGENAPTPQPSPGPSQPASR